ncbi:hypothetical protein LCGC14_2261670 [marine sediment metagenome]|uniref:Uncharacterized protein n=1 Tax=marine sediment metagenome TaxID=412755 RepID=A0A0F9FUL3_9ZZZZ
MHNFSIAIFNEITSKFNKIKYNRFKLNIFIIKMNEDINFEKLPEKLRAGVKRYVERGISIRTILTDIIPAYYRVVDAIVEETAGNAFALGIIPDDALVDVTNWDDPLLVWRRAIQASGIAYCTHKSWNDVGVSASAKRVDPTPTTLIVDSSGPPNGDMELDGDWVNVGTPTVNERSNTQVHGDTYSRKFAVDLANEGIQSDNYRTVNGVQYTYKIWVYPDDDTQVYIRIRKGDNSGYLVDQSYAGLNQDAWNEVEIVIAETNEGLAAYLEVISGATVAGTWYVDDITCEGWNGASIDLTLLMESVL